MNKLIFSAKRAIFILSILGTIIFVTSPPQLSYIPEDEETPWWIEEDHSPEKIVKEFLITTVYLPIPGAQINCCNRSLEWNIADPSAFVNLDRMIMEVSVKGVRFSSFRILLSDIFDDDPIYAASVDTAVKTADGKISHLTVTLWDYGLITPWFLHRKGDGWKPSGVVYVE